jgi:hypothetical protein
VQKNYQMTDMEACAPVVPEQVSVALAELTCEVREGCWPWLWVPGCRCWPR